MFLVKKKYEIRVPNKYISPEFQFYRQFVYEIGALPTLKGKSIAKEQEHLSINRKMDYQITRIGNFRYQPRYFTDSGVIGSKKFVKEQYQLFKGYFDTKKEKKPVLIKGLEGIFSLKRLANGLL